MALERGVELRVRLPMPSDRASRFEASEEIGFELLLHRGSRCHPLKLGFHSRAGFVEDVILPALVDSLPAPPTEHERSLARFLAQQAAGLFEPLRTIARGRVGTVTVTIGTRSAPDRSVSHVRARVDPACEDTATEVAMPDEDVSEGLPFHPRPGSSTVVLSEDMHGWTLVGEIQAGPGAS